MEKEELAIKALEFYHKITEEVDSKGYYRVTDPNEIIVPIDGLIIRCGKRRVVRLKSDIKISNGAVTINGKSYDRKKNKM